MNTITKRCITWLINQLSQDYIYNNENKEIWDKFYEEMKKEKCINFNNLTVEEAKELRFRKWDEELPNLWLFPLWLVPIIPEGLEVMDIGGEKYKYEKETADNDIRFGCVAYGIEIKENNIERN